LPLGGVSRSFAISHARASRRRPTRPQDGASSIGTIASPTAEEDRPLRHVRLWRALGLGFVLLVIYLSLAAPPPDLEAPKVFDFGHIVAYFWLMIWFAQIHRRARRRWLLAAAFGAMGIALEFIQGMTGYRHFDYADMLRNFIGIAIGLLLARTSLQDALYRVEDVLARPRR
jgi:VanZ family protein